MADAQLITKRYQTQDECLEEIRQITEKQNFLDYHQKNAIKMFNIWKNH